MRAFILICAVILMTGVQFARSSPLEIIENNEVPVESNDDELNSSGNSDIVESAEYQKEASDEILEESEEDDDSDGEIEPDMLERMFGIENPICAQYAELKYPLQISHPSDCTKFYKCSNGRGYLFDCPAGEEWSVKHDRCDYPFFAGCIIDGTHQYKLRKVSVRPASSDTIEAVPFMDLAQEKLDKIHTIIDDNDYMVADERCKVGEKDKNHPTHFAHPTNCQMFYKCFNNFAYKTSCPESLHFNPKTEACDYPSVAKCKVSTTESKRILLPTIPNCTHGREVTFAMQGSLTRYFECRQGEVYLLECAKNEFFNINIMKCDSLSRNVDWQSYEPMPY